MLRYILVIIVLSMIVGCKPSNKEGDKILSVTIEPQRYFLEIIVGNHFKVNSIIPSGANPESADFTPAQMIMLDKSTAYFKIGYLGIENMLIDKTRNSSLRIVECSDGIELSGDMHMHTDEDHDHANCHHGHVGGDPHTWSSVKSARIIIENMYKAVVELDEPNAIDYSTNYSNLLAEVNKTDSIIRSYLHNAPSKAFIIYHPALSYFAEEYGLTQYSIEHEGKNPSPTQLKALIDKAKEEGIKTVFIQQEFDTKNAETVAKAIGGRTVQINLLSYNWNEEMIRIARALSTEGL